MKYTSVLAVVMSAFVLTGCFGVSDTSEPIAAPVETKASEVSSGTFTLTAVESQKPANSPTPAELFVAEILEPVTPEVRFTKSYEPFSSAQFETLRGETPFALFFTQEGCSRCEPIENFVDRNFSVLPDWTQIMTVTWNDYPALQEELNVRRPGTMVFYGADGEPVDTLFSPPVERIIDFFAEVSTTDL